MSDIEQQIADAKTLLQLHFGHQDFRPGQEAIVRDILQHQEVVVIMPTGAGKSLCYQLPALCLDGITLVISPLIALMKDQVDSLIDNGIPTTFINSSLSLSETAERLKKIKDNHYKLLYIAPERFYNADFLKLLKEINISLVAIDEAHCISQWGHDFRPSYTKIKDFLNLLNNPKVIALTATATPEVKNDIIKQLSLQSPKIHIAGFNRPNLHYQVIKSNDYQKLEQTIEITRQISGSGIIYASTREKVNAITENLVDNNISACAYHAGLESDERTQIQERFMNNEIKFIVATNAFGLGIDKPDIRTVIHFDMPGTIEAYYQEAGRAGRDGKLSHCILFYHPSDRYVREFFINNENPSIEEIKQIYQILISYDSETINTTYSELSEQTFSKISEMSIGAIIKILEKYNLIQRPKDKENDAIIKFLIDSDQVLNQINSRAKSQKLIIEQLINSFKPVTHQEIKLKINSFLNTSGVAKSTFTKTLNTLQEKNLLEYKPPFRGTEIKILQNISASKLHELIDFNILLDKKQHSLNKLNAMETYAIHNGCRRRYILQYFNDPAPQINCAGCDYCLN